VRIRPVYVSNLQTPRKVVRERYMSALVPRRKSDWFRLVWVTAVNGFFATYFRFNLWNDYAGIGLPRDGFANVSGSGLTIVFVLALGVVAEMLRSRGAGLVNVGIYAVGVVDMVVATARSSRIEPLALVGVALLAAIALVNLLLYLGFRPRLVGD
jgi:hypothetical protein